MFKKTVKTTSLKLIGEKNLQLNESKKIKDEFFSYIDLEILFSQKPKNSQFYREILITDSNHKNKG